MSWLIEHKPEWRTVILVGMILAFLGPWVYDRINVPAQYECSAPNIRLEGDFCGVPLPGVQAFLMIGGNAILICIGLLTGDFIFFDRIRELLISLLILLPLLPVFSTLLLILRPSYPHRWIFTIVPWTLAMGVCLFLSLSFGLKQFLASWGLWLYMGLAVCALIFEILAFSKRNFSVRGEAS